MRPVWREHRWAVAIVALYLALGILYGVTIPIFETPDENGHYAYIHELTEGRGFPVQGTPSGERVTGYVASHPPLYYTLCAVLTFWVPGDVDFRDWAWRNPYHANGFPGSVGNKNFLIHTDAEAFPWRGTPLTVHIARVVSALLGAVAVVGTYGTTWELVGDLKGHQYVAMGAAALTAFNPMFVFTGARVSNDAAVAAFGALTIWGATRLAVRGLSRRGLVLLGTALGLSALSKLSGLTLAPVVAFAFLIDAIRTARHSHRPASHASRLTFDVSRFTFDAFRLFGVAALVSGWWFVRNYLLYGEWLGVNAWLSHTATVRPEPIGLLDVVPQLEGLEMSYWAMFGWFNIPVAPWMYRVWWVLVRLAAVGLAVLLADQWTRWRWPRLAQAGLAVVFIAFLLVFASVWRFITIVLGAQGRYLFPAVAAASTLLMLGLARLSGRVCLPGPGHSLERNAVAPPTGRDRIAFLRILAIALVVAHLVAVLLSLYFFILPAYARPQPVAEADLPQDLTRFDVTVAGTSVQLLGGRIEVDEAHPGDSVPVSLYWRALAPVETDYVAHVRLLGRDWERIAGTDGYPGGGTFPPTLWEPGVIYRDRYLLPVDPQAQAPTLVALEAGLRVQGQAPLTFTLPSGEAWPGPLLLDVAPLRAASPPSTETTYPVEARLGDVFTLVGVDLSAEVVCPGDVITLTLVWQAEQEVGVDYTVFLHLIDSQGTLIAQADAPPLDGAYPTAWWSPGEVVRDPHRLSLPAEIPPGRYGLYVGLYHPATGGRLPAVDADGNRFPDDAIPVVTLEVR